MMLNLLLAIGLLLSPATQLRLGGTPVGPGEICLVAWIAIQLAREACRLGPPLTAPLKSLLVFWALFALAQSLGAIVGLGIEIIPDPISARHDTVAYLLLAAVSCLAVSLDRTEANLNQITWMLALLGNLILAVQLGQAWGMLSIPGTAPFEWDRLRGWSENANALALLCAALAVLPLYLAEMAVRAPSLLLACLLTILPIYAGLMTKSDAFVLSLLTVGPLFVLLKFWKWLRVFGTGPGLRMAAAVMFLLALPVTSVGLSTIALNTDGSIERTVTEVYDDNHQGEERLSLWREALRRGIDAGMLGLGPGAHIVEGKFKRQPPPNFEAHNTFLDLFTQGGIPSVVLFGWLMVRAFQTAWKAEAISLVSLLCGLIIFSLFHLIVRHPIFWFAIVLCFVTGVSGTHLQGRKEHRFEHS